MNRRNFISTSTAAAAAAGLVQVGLQADHHGSKKQKLLELRKYYLDTDEQLQGLNSFLKNAAIPALNRGGVKPIGVFYEREAKEKPVVYVLSPFGSFEQMAGMSQALASDDTFLSAGSDYLSAPKSSPAYARIETSLMLAFEGFPGVVAPVEGSRYFELREYQSHSEAKGILKVEMFNEAEIEIFNRVGLKGVFYGQTIVGANMPNLIYMLAYKDEADQKKGWDGFRVDSGWQELKGVERYKDTVSNIVRTYLVPASYSQV
jgi:hypothetical protein